MSHPAFPIRGLNTTEINLLRQLGLAIRDVPLAIDIPTGFDRLRALNMGANWNDLYDSILTSLREARMMENWVKQYIDGTYYILIQLNQYQYQYWVSYLDLVNPGLITVGPELKQHPNWISVGVVDWDEINV